MSASRTRIATRLTAGFAVVLLLTVIMAAMAVRTMLSMAGMAADLYAHPFAVTNALMQIESQVNAMRADILLMIGSRSPDDVIQLSGQVAVKENEMAASLAVIRSQYLGNPDDVRRLSDRLAEWKAVRDQNIRLCQAGEFDKAAENSRQFATPQIAGLRRELAGIYAFAQDKAAEFSRHIQERRDAALRDIGLTLAGLLLLGMVTARVITRSIVAPLGQLRDAMHQLAEGDLTVAVPDHSRVAEVARMAAAVEVFKQAAIRLESESWIKDSVARLSPALQQTDTMAQFAATALDFLVPLADAGIAVFHARPPGGGRFVRVAGWGLSPACSQLPDSFAPGEGVAGEAARGGQPILTRSPPESWLRIASATGTAAPAEILTVPVMSRGAALAVMEFAAFTPFGPDRRAVIEAALPVLALNMEILERNLRTRELLEETQTQAEELRSSEEELRSQSEALQVANEELRVSEEELKVQQEALQAANEELRLKTEALEERGLALEEARAEADRRAVEVEQASRYKSEFLANMSHELRTPLNSVLILARDLADNEAGNLSAEQMEAARVIHDSGTHLLALINDVLDLSKVEAGKMTLAPVTIPVDGLVQAIRGRFAPVAADKGLDFRVETAPGLPETLVADRGKIEQIVNNLVGNAIKFTARGGVTVRLATAGEGKNLSLSVADTGIGVAEKDRQRIFAAFEQADTGTSRQFGGTGLGLSISRRLARLMGGDITLDGNGESGSVFTLSLPLDGATPSAAPRAPEPPPAEPPAEAHSGADGTPPRTGPATGRRRLLLVDGDESSRAAVHQTLAGLDLDIATAETGARALERMAGESFDCLVLDLALPDMEGAEMLERAEGLGAGLPPVIVHSSGELSQEQTLGIREFTDSIVIKGPRSPERLLDEVGLFLHAIEARASGKTRPQPPAEGADTVLAGRTVLLVDDDMRNAFALSKVLRARGLKVLIAQDGAKALSQLRTQDRIDLVLMDIMMPGMDGWRTMGEIRKDPRFARLPIIALTAKAMPGDRDRCLAAGADDYLTKPVDVDLLRRAMAAQIQRGGHADPQ